MPTRPAMSRSASSKPGRSRWSSFAASASVVAQRTPNPSASASSSNRSFTTGSSVMARTDADTTPAGGFGVRDSVGGWDNTNPHHPRVVFPALFRQMISS